MKKNLLLNQVRRTLPKALLTSFFFLLVFSLLLAFAYFLPLPLPPTLISKFSIMQTSVSCRGFPSTIALVRRR